MELYKTILYLDNFNIINVHMKHENIFVIWYSNNRLQERKISEI